MHITHCFLQVYLLEACVFPLLYLAYITVVIFISYARVGCVAYCTELCWQLTSMQNTQSHCVLLHKNLAPSVHLQFMTQLHSVETHEMYALDYQKLHMIDCQYSDATSCRLALVYSLHSCDYATVDE